MRRFRYLVATSMNSSARRRIPALRMYAPTSMDLDHVLQLPARDVATALDDLKITPGWLVGDAARVAAALAPDEPSLPAPAERRNQAFQNLVVGTLTERIFRRQHLEPLEEHGFTIVNYHEKGENRDFGVQKDGLELPINVKVASTLFRKAQEVVGLDPEDCIPISAYKAIGSTEKVANLVYSDMVDFKLREFVDGIMERLDGSLGIGWHLLSWFGGKGAVRAQNEYLVALFEVLGDELEALVGPARPSG